MQQFTSGSYPLPWGRTTGSQSPWINTSGSWVNAGGSQSPWVNITGSQSPRVNTTGSQSPWVNTTGSSSPWVDTSGSQSPWVDNTGSQSPWVGTTGSQSPWVNTTSSPWLKFALSKTSKILEIPTNSQLYMQVVQQFTEKWKHPTQVPTVIKLWKISPDQTVQYRFSSYQRRVEQNRGISGGNTRRRFHGTVRECCLGDTSCQDELCWRSTCSLCRIIESSFKLAKVGQHTQFGRFGEGIYATATSSKANDYSSGSMSPNKAMLLNDVVMGRVVKLTRTDTSLKQPPHGFDAVVGEPGEDLNYDECVVYNDDAIRPSFLIIYR